MKSWSIKNSDPTERVGSVTVVNVSRPYALKYITFSSTGAWVRPLSNSQREHLYLHSKSSPNYQYLGSKQVKAYDTTECI